MIVECKTVMISYMFSIIMYIVFSIILFISKFFCFSTPFFFLLLYTVRRAYVCKSRYHNRDEFTSEQYGNFSS